MAGLQSSSHAKPKGILFFAGPTGTGKTETAKTLAEKLFGDERRCIRFDMSEYSQSHSDQKLLGAPLGYVGYEAGGQLTNVVSRKQIRSQQDRLVSLPVFGRIRLKIRCIQSRGGTKPGTGRSAASFFNAAMLEYSRRLSAQKAIRIAMAETAQDTRPYTVPRKAWREQQALADQSILETASLVRIDEILCDSAGS